MTENEPYEPGEYHLYGMTAGRMPVIGEDDAKALRSDLRRKIRKGEDYEGASIVSLVRENPLFLAGVSDATLIARANGKDYHSESVRFGALQAYNLIESTFLRRFLESGEGHKIIPQVSEDHSGRTMDVADSIRLIRKTLEKKYGPDAPRLIDHSLGLLEQTFYDAIDDAESISEISDLVEKDNLNLGKQLNDARATIQNLEGQLDSLMENYEVLLRSRVQEQPEFQSE